MGLTDKQLTSMNKFFMLLVIALSCASSTSWADELQPIYIQMDEVSQNQWSIVWKVSSRARLAQNYKLIIPDNCKVTHELGARQVANNIQRQLEMLCTGSLARQSIGLAGLENSQSDALVRISPLDASLLTLRLTADAPLTTINISEPQGKLETTYTYTKIGVEHIVFGFDHLLFVISLVLLISNLSTLFWAITAFTLSHSITLVGTTLGLLALPSQPVEAVIALSIVFLAIEIVKSFDDDGDYKALRLSVRHPWLVAFAFGLLHGFGFAGALAEIGLPNSDRPLALLGFNAGVEFGQLLIVMIATTALFFANKTVPQYTVLLKRACAYLIGSVATYWFIERMF